MVESVVRLVEKYLFEKERSQTLLKMILFIGIFRTLFIEQVFSELHSTTCPNAGKYGPEKSPYLDTFHAV